MSWWRDGVLYQVYPRSFADSNGDGIGDLRGITERLDYLAWLGIDGIWLNPTYPSPGDDGGFDVTDYYGVHPDLGTLADLERLVRAAGARGIRVLLDLVPNHTSDRHPWFQAALASRDCRYRDFYVWRDPSPDGSPPNNWRSIFGGSAWELDRRSGQYYMHNFLTSMPDLDWWNPAVRDEFDDIVRFWLDRGVAGLRIDVAHGIVKDRELRDNPPAEPGDAEEWRRLGQRPVHSMNRPEVHEVLRRWRGISDGYGDTRVLVGETWVYELEQLAAFYGNGDDELHLAFNFVFLTAAFEPERLAEIVARTERALPAGAWPVWAVSNHDLSRFPTRWGEGNERLARCLLMLLLTLRGTPVLYYGDELGMPDAHVPADKRRDRVAEQVPGYPERDRARTPMPWNAEPGTGFTDAGVAPWLPFRAHEGVDVAAQREDPGSPLRLSRDLIALRRRRQGLRTGAYVPLESPRGVWVFRRGEDVTVALNLSGAPARVEDVAGVVEIGTERARDGERVAGTLKLSGWEGVVVIAP